MHISVAWMNSLLDRPATADEIIEVLTNVGFPCDAREELHGGDVRLDIEITSNRGDCVSHLGLARELAATTGRRLTIPGPNAAPSTERSQEHASVAIAAPDLCTYLSGRVILGVKVSSSPAWLRQRIEAVGLRSVNNVVDVTNFVLFGMGQPLHAFDLRKLEGRKIQARKSAVGETLKVIDGSTVRLGRGMLVIADDKRAVAVAGVMGGSESEVSTQTTDIILEAAVFEPASIRTTSRTLNILTDASYRFERGIHPATVALAADLAASMIVEVAGGTWCADPLVAGGPIPPLRQVTLRPARCRKVLGVEIPDAQVVELLTRLDLCPRPEGQIIHCTVPAHRLDLRHEIDLIEEVLRHYGLPKIPVKDRISIEARGPQTDVASRRRVDDALAACGYHEVVTFSFITPDEAKDFLPPGMEPLMVLDDRRKAEPVLRPSILPSLLRCRKRNQDMGHADVRLFEHAACFAIQNGKKIENINLGLLADVAESDSGLQSGLRRMRGTIDAIIRAAVGTSAEISVRKLDGFQWFEAGSAASVHVDGQVVGTFGILSMNLQRRANLRGAVAVAELGIIRLLSRGIETVSSVALTTQPAVDRDLTLLLPEETAWESVEVAVRNDLTARLPGWFENLEFLGTYRGKQVGSGRKSVSMRMIFRAADRTLRREDIDPAIMGLVERLKGALGAELRS